MRARVIVAVIAIGVGAAGAWFVFAQGTSGPGQQAASHARSFFKPPQAYDTSSGQQMKPRW